MNELLIHMFAELVVPICESQVDLNLRIFGMAFDHFPAQ